MLEIAVKRLRAVITATIQHWERMIEWVEACADMKERPDDEHMYKEICEDWFADCCPLCAFFKDKSRGKSTCRYCPLAIRFGECDQAMWKRTENAWNRVYDAKTWKGWLRAARSLVKQLNRL